MFPSKLSHRDFYHSSSKSSSPSNKSQSNSGRYSDISTVVAVSYFNRCSSSSSTQQELIESPISGNQGLIISRSSSQLDQQIQEKKEELEKKNTLRKKIPSFIIIYGTDQKTIGMQEVIDSDLSSDDEKQQEKDSGKNTGSKAQRTYSSEKQRVRQRLFERMGNTKV